MEDKKIPITIGRAEKVYISDYLKKPVIAKVDTGADLSSIWASSIREHDGMLAFSLFGPEAPEYTGEVIELPEEAYSITRIANSFGQREVRYTVKLRIKLAGRVIRATFTLADRSSKTYPILLGRRLLQGKFVVDVAKGRPLRQEEKEKQEKMHLELKRSSDKLGE
jgi:hypothetical protein